MINAALVQPEEHQESAFSIFLLHDKLLRVSHFDKNHHIPVEKSVFCAPTPAIQPLYAE